MAVGRNNTIVTKFILLGFSDHPQMKIFLFVLFLGIYLLTLVWNLSLIALIRMDPHLHTPMYFFLSNLSFLDIGYVSSTTPKMLSDIITGQKTISFVGCATQYFVFCGMGLSECFLLAAMAYDRYAAICNPLLYTVLISHALCLKMVAGAYVDFSNAFSSLFSDFRGTKPMIGGGNITEVTYFILLGFSDFPRILAVLFVVFLLIYIMTLTWNLDLIILIRMDSHLHTPMYFFLSNLSFLDICYVTSTAPKMLSNFFQEQQTITFVGCAFQYFVFSTMGVSESCLMTAMAYDRYAAICNPLVYSSVMSPTLCIQMVLGSYLAGLSASVSQLCAILQLHFCGPNVINHFFCDMPQLLVLSCTDTFFVQLLLAILTVIFGIINALIIMVSYCYIVISIMKITSAKGRSKAFNTCASHLTAV
ncbi:O5AN1 protein, partial [Crocuta crocuta]